ncbi:hypothetical protein K461DRAFT_276496 [Myriangium duriaei CBS 260.36]|uniref:Phytase-like domain-containing protein n=1 Tax=Myriangium duriaei CBS 260.36 TaxID=1168546 RepID=A0A9P4JA87_9PEZI|nr:hypothetical protein K461DRAFT_276496 [Myriangium duriaei CBS 260.36]
MLHSWSILAPLAAALLPLTAASPAPQSTPASQTTCNGKSYVYSQLAGYGFVPSDARDRFGDSIGGIGSAIFIDPKSWALAGHGVYTGTLFALPDRGWNTEGTLNYQNRVHKFRITLTSKPNATVEKPSGPNLNLAYLDTIRFTDPQGVPTSGLDANADGPYLTFPGIDFQLPSVNYTGDGFGGAGPGGHRVVVDSEGLVMDSQGCFWVSDEYGPYIYRFDPSGIMVAAIQPPEAFLPHRNGSVSFNSDTAPYYDPNVTITPSDPDNGRSNNQGFEGLTISDDGKSLFALLQSATIQDGGGHKADRRYARLLHYDITKSPPAAIGEYVVPLPLYSNGSLVAAQSDIHFVSETQFLILARDSNAGHGQKSSTSLYRHADVFDISNATNVLGATYDGVGGSVASSKGVLHAGIVPAGYCSFLDYNDNAQLNRFGVRNGGAQGSDLLNEKWESLALVPVDGKEGRDGEWFLFSLSDNDFITQEGRLDGGKFTYKDGSGYSLDNQALVFQVKLPKGGK